MRGTAGANGIAIGIAAPVARTNIIGFGKRGSRLRQTAAVTV